VHEGLIAHLVFPPARFFHTGGDGSQERLRPLPTAATVITAHFIYKARNIGFGQPGGSCPFFAVVVMSLEAALAEHSFKRFLHERVGSYILPARNPRHFFAQGLGYVDAKPHCRFSCHIDLSYCRASIYGRGSEIANGEFPLMLPHAVSILQTLTIR
jgi:hypothetical protein